MKRLLMLVWIAAALAAYVVFFIVPKFAGLGT